MGEHFDSAFNPAPVYLLQKTRAGMIFSVHQRNSGCEEGFHCTEREPKEKGQPSQKPGPSLSDPPETVESMQVELYPYFIHAKLGEEKYWEEVMATCDRLYFNPETRGLAASFLVLLRQQIGVSVLASHISTTAYPT